MADKVRDRLKELAAYLENEHAVESVEESLEHLQRATADCMVRSRALAQQATIYLFQSHDPPSLIEFLDVSGAMSEDVRKREISHARIKVLDLLAAFVKTFGGHNAVTRRHVVELTKRCQVIARGDWSNKVRSTALDVVINVLKYADARVTAEDLDPSSYVDKLFYDLKFSKATQTAKGTMLEVIGHIATGFPARVEPKVQQLLPWIEDQLEKQFATSAPEMLLINGLLEALARLLVFDVARYERDAKDNSKRQQLYTYLHRILATTVDGQMSRYQVTKSALQFLTIHAELFYDEIGANAYTWFSFMKFCMLTDTKKVKANAYSASDSVMQVIGKFLGAEKDDQRKKTLNRLLKELLPVLAESNSSTTNVAFTLQVLGYLSTSILVYLGEKGFLKIEDRLRKFGENLLVLDERATAMRWSTFSSFLQCFAKFAQQPRAGSFDSGYISFMEDVVLHVLNAYPQCLWKSKVTLYKSILLIVRAAQKQGEKQRLLGRIVNHLLLLTLSNVTEMQGDVILYHPDTGNAETKLLYEFEELWLAILRGKKYTKYKGKDITALRNQVTKMAKVEGSADTTAERLCILNTLLHALSEIIDNLDLSYQYDLQEARTGASSGGYKPNVPRDHSIMLNLTEFMERLVPRLEPSQLRFWIPSTMLSMFGKSRQLPLVSPFYRIIRVLALTADSLQLFENVDGAVTTSTAIDSNALRSHYESFVSRVVHNLRFYKEELLVATSGCVLATPLPLLRVEDFAEAVAPALLIGRSFFPAAEMAITGLEKWQEAVPTRLESIFDRIIPCLAVYLDQNEAGAADDVAVTGGYKEKDAVITEASSDSDWAKLQRRVMTFIGKAGGQASLLLSRGADSTEGMSRRGFSVNSLSIPLCLGDVSVDVSLDKLFSHLGGLACESTDRRVKAAACEVYHALVCYLCGMTATHPHTSSSKSEYYNVWKAVIPVIISLAIDAEKICRSLFEPLLFQVTRWFCHGSDTFPHEFASLLDELIDGLSHETSTAIREMSGKCLSMCLTSAVENGGVDTAQGLAKADAVFQRLFSLCRHPGPAQRTGAATAISYFLRTLREEDIGVVQAFGLRCLKNFLFSLKLCGRDARVGKTDVQILEDMITKAILKLQRAVVRYPTAFTRSKKSATKGDDVQHEEGDNDLAGFTDWLFCQCASRETVYRTTCRQLFLSFAPIVTGSSSKAWMEEYATRAEANAGGDPIHIALAPLDQLAVVIHTNDRTNWNLQVTIDWLDQLTASLECYTWCSSILGGAAKKYLCPPSGASTKRKLFALSQSTSVTNDSESQLVVAWAICSFLQHFDSLSELQEETNKHLDLNLRLTLRQSLLKTVVTICELVNSSLTSSVNLIASEILKIDDASSQQLLSKTMIKAISLSVAASVRRDQHADDQLMKIKQVCRLVVDKNAGFAKLLQETAAACMANTRMLITTTSSPMEPTELLLSLRTMDELLACGLLSNFKEPGVVENLVRVAAHALDGNIVSPISRSLAIEAMKTACCLGWDVNAMFDDKALGQRLSAIYRDLLRFFPHEDIWDRVVSVIVTTESENYAPRFEALVELLNNVVLMGEFAPRSAAIDAFCQTYAPQFQKLLNAMKGELATNQQQKNRLLLEVVLNSIPIFTSCSKRVYASLNKKLFSAVRDIATTLLRRRDASHFVKGDCLSVLAAVGPAEDALGNNAIQEALSGFVIDEFPISSADVKRGSRDYDVFRMLLGKLLSIVEAYRRADYLPTINFALKEGDRHLFWEDIRTSLGRLATAVTSRDDTASGSTAGDFLVEVADLLLDSSSDQSVRRSVLDELCIPILELQNAANLSKFYVAHTKGSSTVTMISKLATIVANSGDIASPGAFLTAAVAFSLVEVLYRLVDPDLIRGEINNAFLGHTNGKGREFTMLVCKCASKFVTKAYDHLTDMTRFTHWKAYNCLLTAVSRTQKQEKFFDQILFQDSLWINIIDVALEYELRTETKAFDRVPLSRLSATTLRQRQQQQDGTLSQSNGSRRGSSRDSSSSLRFFTGSSLSQARLATDHSQQFLTSTELAAQEAVYSGVEIELDAINDHPCMVPLLRVLKQMKADFGDGWNASTMPVWMKKIFDVVANPTTELNIRLFIVKVVLNVPDVFERYSSLWADKMMDALLEATVSSSSGKAAEFHYLLRDFCTLMIHEWQEVDVAKMSTTASRYVNELIELAPNEEHNLVMQDNLALIAQLIQLWKSHLRIDSSIVSKLLFSRDENPRREAADRYAALQVISAMLTAGMFGALTSDTVNLMSDGPTLEAGIVQAMEHKRPSIYNVAAEVSGLLLAAQESTPSFGVSSSQSHSFRTKLLEQITKYYSEEDFGRFLALLRSVSLHDASVLDTTMLHRLSFVLPRVVAIEAWSLSAAECLVHAAKHTDDKKALFTHCQSVLPRFLSHRNGMVQLHAVHLVEALVPGLEDDAIDRLVATEHCGGHDLFRHSLSQQDSSIRRVLINLAINLYKRNMASATTELIREQLLRGLADSDIEIRRLVRDFCQASSLAFESCADCLSALFQRFFSPGVADLWILYSTNLLLEMNATSDTYEATLFKSSLSQGEFHEAPIDSAWESKDQTMTPLFSVEADKFSASSMLAKHASNGSFSSQGFSIGTSSSLLDASLPSQSQLISSNLASQEFMGSAFYSQGSFGVSQSQSSGAKRQQRRFTKRATAPGAPSSQHGSHVTTNKYGHRSDKSFFQDRYAMVKKNEEAMRNRQRMARAQQVVMRRKYRVGDYPDIQIKLRDVLDPLMGLCEMHSPTSAIVLANLMAAILTTKTVRQDTPRLQMLGAHVDRALVAGKHSLIFVSAVHLAFFASVMKDSSLVQSVGISYQAIGTSSLASSSSLSGELLLEEYLILDVPQSRDEAAECWDQLYKILATNQKSNLLVALASRCCTTEESKVALQAQLAGDLPGAIASYRKAESTLEGELETQPDDALLGARFELHRCAWERYGCLERLNHWDKLHRELVRSSDNFGSIWQEPSPYLEQGIGHCLRALLGPLGSNPIDDVEESEAAQDLQAFLASAEQETQRWDVVMARYGVEASLASIALGEIGRARVQVEQVYGLILKRWAATSKIARRSRLEILQNLSSAVEIDDALTLSSRLQLANANATLQSRLEAFTHRWSQVLPSLGEGSMVSWSQFYMVQQVLSNFIQRTGKQEGILSLDHIASIHHDLAQLMLRYAGAGVQNDVLALASKYLKDYRALCNAENLPKVSVLMVDVFVSHVLKLAERQAHKSALHSDRLAPDAMTAITRYYQTSTKMFDNADILELMEKLPLADRVAMGSLEAKTFGTAAQFYMSADLDAPTTQEFFTRAFDTFQRSSRAIPAPTKYEPTSRESAETSALDSFARCRTMFIEFLVDVLFSTNATDWTRLINRQTLVVALMDNVLGGMASGNQECANYFPQLCELLPAFPESVADFERRVLTQVPIWTCLRWSSQLLALVNGAIGPTIVKILEKMAAEYPVALFYDFKLTFNDLQARTNASKKVDLSRLQLLLSNPVMEKFVDALRLIHHPELRLKEGLREIAKLLDDGKTVAAKAKVAHIWQDCFASEHPRLGSKIGHYNRDWAKRAKRDVEKLMGRDGSNLSAKTVLAAREWIANHFTVVPGKHGITKDMKARLGDFAEWLDEFDHSRLRLELPGQYTTRWGKPDPSNHIHILSIHSTLGVLVSKQLPKQITLHCSDQSNHTFLVKGGEDLRLDQRIEQLFDVMNQILSSDARCRDRNLRTKTYNVIPMTTEIGMIEWLHNTSTIKGIIERQLQLDPRCQQLQSNKRAKLQLFNTIPAKQYESFLMKQRGSSFAAKVVAPSQHEVTSNFDTVHDLIPADLLRRQLISLGADFEDFISIRDEFASSLAVFNACSYILGIGDRHLDNFLMDHATGRVIGIDFGVSFGAGASVLPVPELIPFRFTRQMESVLLPYDSANLLIQDMQAVFEALRAKKQVIESVMNVFLHEPLLDWQQSITTHQREIFRDASISDDVTQVDDDVKMENAVHSSEDSSIGVHSDTSPRKRAKRQPSLPGTASTASASTSSAPSGLSFTASSISATAPSTAWLPDVKIAIARRKLDGLSPRVLLKEELAQNPHLGKQLARFQALVDTAVTTGPPSVTPMSSLAQAQELVALATAPDLLGRTYHGWTPWL